MEERQKKLIIQSPFGNDEDAVIAGASDNKTLSQLRTDVVNTAKRFGDTLTTLGTIDGGNDIVGVAPDKTKYETFDKELILTVEDQMKKPF